MDLITTKVCVALLFGILRFFFGILPLKLYKILMRWEGEEDTQHFVNKRRHQQVICALALCQSFGGGVLLATCLLHMMPEVYFTIEELKKYGSLNTKYPLSQMTISAGFFLVYFVEEFSHWFITKVPDKPCEKALDVKSVKSVSRENSAISRTQVVPFQVKEAFSPPPNVFIIEDECKKEKERFEALSNISYNYNEEVLKENEKNTEQANDDLTTNDLHHDESFEENESMPEEVKIKEREYMSSQQIMRQVLTLVALSLHAIFEGLSIGLQSSIANIWYLFVAVMIHSGTILFYIGLQLVLAKAAHRVILINISVLAMTSPIGVLLGLLITLKANMNTKAKSIAVVLLEGLSAGTILYITFFEVLNKEKKRTKYRFRRAMCILAGFGLMALLQCWEVHLE